MKEAFLQKLRVKNMNSYGNKNRLWILLKSKDYYNSELFNISIENILVDD